MTSVHARASQCITRYRCIPIERALTSQYSCIWAMCMGSTSVMMSLSGPKCFSASCLYVCGGRRKGENRRRQQTRIGQFASIYF